MKYRVKNWDKFQHYKPKTYADETKKMPWFKLYGIDLLEDYEFNQMSHDQQAILIKLWCLASQYDGFLPEDQAISYRLRYPIEFINSVIKSLSKWIIECDYKQSMLDRDKDRDKDKDIYVLSHKSFLEFWDSYPARKISKTKCEEKWRNRKLYEIKDEILDHIKKMKDTRSWKEGYVPATTTYINQSRWNDPVEESKPMKKVWEGGI